MPASSRSNAIMFSLWFVLCGNSKAFTRYLGCRYAIIHVCMHLIQAWVFAWKLCVLSLVNQLRISLDMVHYAFSLVRCCALWNFPLDSLSWCDVRDVYRRLGWLSEFFFCGHRSFSKLHISLSPTSMREPASFAIICHGVTQDHTEPSN